MLIKSFRLYLFILLISLGSAGFAQVNSVSGDADSSNFSLLQGYEAFKNEDWNTASMFLRKAVSLSVNSTAENYFMLIKSGIYSGEYKMAQEDCDRFLEKFPLSAYVPYVQYQNGRLLHLLGKNDDAVIVLSDFCKNHYDDELYPLALFWTGECFYDEYNFDLAKGLYERLVSEFPDSAKVSEARYKLDLISQRSREEKLLYLLKVIGEENLSTREEYERQLRIYQSNLQPSAEGNSSAVSAEGGK